MHRDLKLENILLDQEGLVKLIDLGLGNFFDMTGSGTLSTFCGSPDYAPPELWANKPYYGPELDIWSLGVVLFVMSTGFLPFNESSLIIELRYHFPLPVSFELQNLIQRIFCVAKKRCTMEQLIAHRWLNDGGKLEPISRRHIQGPFLSIRCTEVS